MVDPNYYPREPYRGAAGDMPSIPRRMHHETIYMICLALGLATGVAWGRVLWYRPPIEATRVVPGPAGSVLVSDQNGPRWVPMSTLPSMQP